MTEIRNNPVWVIRNWNLDIIWDLVLGDWCFYGMANILFHFLHKSARKGLCLTVTILDHPFEKVQIEMGLIFKPAFHSLFLLAQIIAGASLHIDQNPRQSNPFKVWPMLSIKGLATGANKSSDT